MVKAYVGYRDTQPEQELGPSDEGDLIREISGAWRCHYCPALLTLQQAEAQQEKCDQHFVPSSHVPPSRPPERS
jgi:hypothetical protein